MPTAASSTDTADVGGSGSRSRARPVDRRRGHLLRFRTAHVGPGSTPALARLALLAADDRRGPVLPAFLPGAASSDPVLRPVPRAADDPWPGT